MQDVLSEGREHPRVQPADEDRFEAASAYPLRARDLHVPAPLERARRHDVSLQKLPEMVRKSMELVFVDHVDELLEHVLETMPGKKAAKKGKKKPPRSRGRASAPPPA